MVIDEAVTVTLCELYEVSGELHTSVWYLNLLLYNAHVVLAWNVHVAALHCGIVFLIKLHSYKSGLALGSTQTYSFYMHATLL